MKVLGALIVKSMESKIGEPSSNLSLYNLRSIRSYAIEKARMNFSFHTWINNKAAVVFVTLKLYIVSFWFTCRLQNKFFIGYSARYSLKKRNAR